MLQTFGYPFNQVGKYYESIYLYRSGQFEKARELLECVAESAPTRYRSKALLSLAGVEERIGRFEESLRFRLQVSRDDPVTFLEAQCGMAARRGIEGEHQAALRDLERFMPLAHLIGKRGHPAYVTFLNSYAVELSDSNRAEDAEQVAKVIATSPFIGRYPEWQETVLEIETKRKRPSMIAIPHQLNLKYRDPRVRSAVDFMQANFHRYLVLDDIAKAVDMPTERFSRLFKTETGFTAIDYLIRLRIEKAPQLLKTGFLSVKEVMAAVGFNSKSHFARYFKRRFGSTPSEYKRRARASH